MWLCDCECHKPQSIVTDQRLAHSTTVPPKTLNVGEAASSTTVPPQKQKREEAKLPEEWAVAEEGAGQPTAAEAQDQVALQVQSASEKETRQLELLELEVDRLRRALQEVRPQAHSEQGKEAKRENSCTRAVQKCKSFFIRHVNPKFIYFDKPFFLAVTVALVTWGIFAMILWQLLLRCSTRQVSQTGGEANQAKFVVAARASGASICLQEAKFLSTFESNGIDMIFEQICMPGASFVSTWPVSDIAGTGLVSSQDLPYYEEGIAWCDTARYMTDAECKDVAGVTCPSCVPENSRSRDVVFKLVYRVTRCPEPSHMIGVALSYSTQIEVFTTVIIVFLLMGIRVLYQKGPKGKQGLCDAMKEQLETMAEDDAEAAAKDAVNNTL
eukprot:TRINITY_DN20353_c0_g1_i1.p1 TRINITY_DN20353_c0_g1~~TRINITY_DN20353_c0_g1_i1.p1  ORF type:complete len:384 (-),score=58.02 TRINITY_DN20353_c0_g1_i1:160-1311(-)